MKYWMDTEFIERMHSLDLISIGLVAEDGREFYAESSEVDWTKASRWVLQHVRPQLSGTGVPLEEIGYAVRRFVDDDKHPVFWGYFPAYDWVLFSGLFGGMNDLPFAFPHLCLDIKQWAIELGDPELPRQTDTRHHALADARWTRDAWRFLAGIHPTAAERRSFGYKHPIQNAANPPGPLL
jgi:3' exoribonuclease, RNase T-like